MFLPHSNLSGAVHPWEYLPAAAGSYQVGQLLTVSGGQLAAITAARKTTPEYVCMATKTAQAGENLPVIRVDKETIFETSLSAEAATAAIGSLLEISAGGEQVDAAAAGTFELCHVEGTAKDSIVRGRFT